MNYRISSNSPLNLAMPCASAMAFWSSARTTIEPTWASRIWVSEIIPDKILDMVDETEAMDAPHEDLL